MLYMHSLPQFWHVHFFNRNSHTHPQSSYILIEIKPLIYCEPSLFTVCKFLTLSFSFFLRNLLLGHLHFPSQCTICSAPPVDRPNPLPQCVLLASVFRGTLTPLIPNISKCRPVPLSRPAARRAFMGTKLSNPTLSHYSAFHSLSVCPDVSLTASYFAYNICSRGGEIDSIPAE